MTRPQAGILVIVLTLLAAGGFAIWYFLFRNKAPGAPAPGLRKITKADASTAFEEKETSVPMQDGRFITMPIAVASDPIFATDSGGHPTGAYWYWSANDQEAWANQNHYNITGISIYKTPAGNNNDPDQHGYAPINIAGGGAAPASTPGTGGQHTLGGTMGVGGDVAPAGMGNTTAPAGSGG